MNRLNAFIAVAGVAAVGTACSTQEKQPNVLFIYIDDMGYGDLSCYGGDFTPTPNIDRLAEQGARFEQYYSASPVSSASRCGLLTGNFPIEYGINTYLSDRRYNRNCEQVDFLDPSAPTIIHAFQDAGYTTAHIGKWHLGGGRDVDNAPSITEYGFDSYLSTYESPDPDPAITSTDWIWHERDSVQRWKRTEYFVNKSIEFLKENGDKPFYLNLWPDDIHTPWVPEALYYDNPDSWVEERTMTPVIAETDKQIGRLLDYLDESGLAENTIVVITSDNGPENSMKYRRTAGLRGVKNSVFEGGIRMPFIVRYPGKIKPGTLNKESVLSALDLYPSLCDMAGVEMQEGYQGDGENRSDIILGNSTEDRSGDLMWDFGRNSFFRSPSNEYFQSPHLAIRRGDWKLLVNGDGSNAMLFNLKEDVAESTNVIEENSKIAEELKTKVLEWYNKNKDNAKLALDKPALLPASNFETTIDEKSVKLYTLKNSKGMTMQVTNFGAKVVALWVDDINGKWNDVVLGYENIDRYVNNNGERFLGSTIGRYGNRIADGKFTLDGKEYTLSTYNNGQCLHGGDKGFDKVVWDVESVTDNEIVFRYLSKDMEEGFPGNLDVKMTYTITEDNEFKIVHHATTDKRTPVNLTHHSFFNLHGEGVGSINDHIVTINADQYTPVDEVLIPIGYNVPVKNTPFDFRKPKAISTDVECKCEQMVFGGGYDHNFVINRKTENEVESVATVYDPISGRVLEVLSSEPGLQFYGGNFFDGKCIGKSGKPYNYRASFAMETQHFPDSPNQPSFPSTILNPDEEYSHTCIYRFSLSKDAYKNMDY